MAHIPSGAHIITMCIEGNNSLSSLDLSKYISSIAMSHNKICFIIGGRDGISNHLKNLSNFKFSMSKLTFPHQLARVMLVEQIYRSFSIINNINYHSH